MLCLRNQLELLVTLLIDKKETCWSLACVQTFIEQNFCKQNEIVERNPLMISIRPSAKSTINFT